MEKGHKHHMEKNLSKTERSIALTARYSIATSRVIPGLADEALIDELMDVARVYEELINEGLPRFDDVNRELYVAANFLHTQALMVKGVSDYGDKDKDDSYHGYASAVSALYMLSLVREYVTSQRIQSLRGAGHQPAS